MRKIGRPDRSNDVISHGQRRSCISPLTRPSVHDVAEAMTLLIVWASGWRYTTTSQTTSNYITRLMRPSRFSHIRRKTREEPSTRLPSAKLNSSPVDTKPNFTTTLHSGLPTTNMYKVYIIYTLCS